jgi:hypothetical protein
MKLMTSSITHNLTFPLEKSSCAVKVNGYSLKEPFAIEAINQWSNVF